MRISSLLILLVLVGACQDSEVSRAVGARCVRAADCEDRCLAPSGDWPGGFCTLTCVDDRDGPGDAACIDDEGGVCAFLCETDPGCSFLGGGYTCTERDARDAPKVFVCRG